jgi:hypothetical protein
MRNKRMSIRLVDLEVLWVALAVLGSLPNPIR